ncbi:GAF domain-containing sensor histidine kinase [Actinomadura gamaensis]|uniref:Oxygen sensor histidine kinase NreB n=1 Tax=Actinomadura gamaensis TaxID=1763541 RepID=A0ABV9TXT6_9ACTN
MRASDADRADVRSGEEAALHAVSSAVLAVTRHLSVREVLQVIVRAAAQLLDARYAALGVPDDEGSFAEFVVEGVSDAQWEKIGPLPRQHGMLAAMLRDNAPKRLSDIRREPEFEGWPAAHPVLKDFLGVPIRDGDQVLGILFLANRRHPPRAASTPEPEALPTLEDAALGAGERAEGARGFGEGAGGERGFSERDQELLTLFAAHAAIAITNARLYETNRELTVVAERNRLARELHDAVAQKLFSLRLTARAASALAERDPARAVQELDQVERLAADALAELRAVIFELRPADLADGLAASLRKHAEVLDRAYDARVVCEADGAVDLDEEQELVLFRIAQEALYNALRHAGARTVRIRLASGPDAVTLEIADDGVGFTQDAPNAATEPARPSPTPAGRGSSETASAGTGPSAATSPGTDSSSATSVRTGSSGIGPFGVAASGGVASGSGTGGGDTPGNNGSNGLGLVSMRDRAFSIGGTLSIDTAPGRGTVVRVEVAR